jgi:hypothetical protein
MITALEHYFASLLCLFTILTVCPSLPQAVCVCDKDSIDMVMGRLAHCGVGNICGSINILSLDTSMYSKAATDMLKDDVPANATGDAEDAHEDGESSSSDEEEAEQRKMFRETASQLRVEQVVEKIRVCICDAVCVTGIVL